MDYAAVTAFDVALNEMQAIAENGKRFAERIGHEIHSAVIAPTPLGHGMVRMYAALNTYPGLTVEIFTSAEAAEQWLAKVVPLRPPTGPTA